MTERTKLALMSTYGMSEKEIFQLRMQMVASIYAGFYSLEALGKHPQGAGSYHEHTLAIQQADGLLDKV